MRFDRANCHTLQAIVPKYDQWGNNGTEIWLTTGEIVYDKRRLDTVLKELAGVFAIDLPRLRRNVARDLGRARNVPLPLTPDLALVPVTARKAVAGHDGARGYLVLGQVASITAVDDGTAVSLPNHNQPLPLAETEQSLKYLLVLTKIASELTFGAQCTADDGQEAFLAR